MKKKIYIITIAMVVMFVFSVSQSFAIEVSPSGTHYVGDTLSFRPSNKTFSSAYSTNWNFGDGTTYTTTSGMDTVTHSYSSPGSYTVQVVGQFTTISPITETVTVIIEQLGNNRYIEVEPDQPIVGEPATFRAYNFNTPDTIVWDMGDGTILKAVPKGRSFRTNQLNRPGYKKTRRGSIMGTNVVTHTYSAPGNYTVTAYDNNGDDGSPTRINITVRLPNRGITYTPLQPLAGAPVQFNAVNFLANQIDWNFGDGTTITGGSTTVTHVYNNAGTYTVTARETNSQYPTVSISVTVRMPNRQIIYQPTSPRVDQEVYFQTREFITNSIDWNFGDGTMVSGGSTTMSHRFMTQGTYTVSAKDSTINHTPVTTVITILAENRYIVVSPPEIRTNEPVTVTAFNFRGDYILWDFGDGTQRSGLHSETHQYTRAGTYTITAQDENGESQVRFTAQVIVKGINDQVNLEIAEIRLDNGKYYKVVPKNSKNLRATLRMKMRGTGIVSGYWIVDGHPFEFFNEVVYQGEIKEIHTRQVPGLPVIDPGIHTITLRLTQPAEIPVTFPILKYFVLPHENILKTLTPPDGFIAKEKEIPEFSWEEPRGASKYQIVFANYLYPIMNETFGLKWIDVGTALKYTPDEETWNRIKRNRWTYWKVRALDTSGNTVAESDALDIKVVVATANINIQKAEDLEGNEIAIINGSSINTTSDDILVQGNIQYLGNSPYLVLRVYVDNQLTDQLLFRDVKKNEVRYFETSIPNKKMKSNIFFKVLKTSSPAVIVGIKGLILKK
jgi:PKD repeat protein